MITSSKVKLLESQMLNAINTMSFSINQFQGFNKDMLLYSLLDDIGSNTKLNSVKDLMSSIGNAANTFAEKGMSALDSLFNDVVPAATEIGRKKFCVRHMVV